MHLARHSSRDYAGGPSISSPAASAGGAQENVVSNVFKGTSILNVGGVSEASAVGGVMIWRPLMAHVKVPPPVGCCYVVDSGRPTPMSPLME